MKLAHVRFLIALICWVGPGAYAQSPAIPVEVLVQSPADTTTDLQAICLFRSSPENTLHGSLTEMNQKLKGLLDRIRKPELFGGEFGETVVIAPPKGTLGAKKLLIIGLGDSETFSPQLMQRVGRILYTEASNLGVAHPFFAPTILDGGVTKFATGDVAGQFISGFLRAEALARVVRGAGASASQTVTALTFLAGAAHASDTRAAIDKAVAAASGK